MMTVHHGKGVCPGIAFGTIYLLKKAKLNIDKTPVGSAAEEWARFIAAKHEADTQLSVLFDKAVQEIGEEEAMILDVQRLMLEDSDFNSAVEHKIKEDACSAAYAVAETGKAFAATFAALDDPYMQARAADVEDMAKRVVDNLLGRKRELVLKQSIIVAEDITPSETLQMDKAEICAFVLAEGSSKSHTAILAQAMNIPCIVQADILPDASIDGKAAIVNGGEGVCYLNPDEETQENMRKLQVEHQARLARLQTMRGLETVTKSGKRVQLCANIGGVDDLEFVRNYDAEGIGLFRSEFSYMGRNTYPTEEELFSAYREVAEAMGDKQVVIRTLDIGADKQVDYFKLDEEENPALGLRGIRLCIERPEVFRTQLRAIYRASAFGNIAIMFPMIASVWEVRHAKTFAEEVCRELKDEGIAVGSVDIGIMIETPAAVMILDDLAKEVAFFSVGTNDLTQYTLAIDRQSGKLDRFYDAHHPAVLEMLRRVAESANNNGIWAGICGELAADKTLTRAFIDMGFHELSFPPAYVLEMREWIRNMD